MPSFNRVILCGNLTRDPELKYLPSGTSVCEFAIAVNKKWTGKDGEKKEEVSFFDCVVWDKRGETFAKYMTKGRPVLIEGELRQERWTDKEDQKRSRIRITVSQFTFLGSKDDASNKDAEPEQTENGSGDPF